MPYNPKIHDRKSIRLKGYDYAQAGAYFITICCENKKNRFGKISVGDCNTPAQMKLNEYGQIAFDEWIKLTDRFPNFKLDAFQIMPNHIHGIIVLTTVGTTLAVVQTEKVDHNQQVVQNEKVDHDQQVVQNEKVDHNQMNSQNEEADQIQHDSKIKPVTQPAPSISDIIGAYKSLVVKGCLEISKSKKEIMGKLWQRNFYENIIRTEKSYENISNYIINNPAKWADDKFYIQS